MPTFHEMVEVVYAAFAQRKDSPDCPDVVQRFRDLGVDFTTKTVEHIFDESDSNKDGRLSLREFTLLGDKYPKMLDCLYHRVTDKKKLDYKQDSVLAAKDEMERLEQVKRDIERSIDEANQKLYESEREAEEEEKRLREEKEKEASMRAQVDAEKGGEELSSKDVDGIHDAVGKAARGVCDEKKEHFCATLSEDEVVAFGKRLAKEWRRKDGDLVDELCANLVAPPSAPSKLSVIAEAARFLADTKGGKYPQSNRLELLVMALYTMAGPDIDALMGFDHVPTYDEKNKGPWDQYNRSHSKSRNSAIFSAVNWAMRTAADPKKEGSKEHEEAWTVCRKWIKYIGLLVAICVGEDPNDTKSSSSSSSADTPVVARGIAGLPPDIFEAHKRMKEKDIVSWPAPSSCAFDRSVSEAYIKGEAANANKSGGGSVLFLVSEARWGISLQNISKYPKEAEMLIPPFSKFKIKFKQVDSSMGDAVVLKMKCKGHNAPDDWCQDVYNTSQSSSKKLEQAVVGNAEAEFKGKQAEYDKEKNKERAAQAEAMKCEREEEKAKSRVSMAENEAGKAEKRLDELERLLEEQRKEVQRRNEDVFAQRNTLGDAQAARERADREKEEASRDAAEAQDRMRSAEENLMRVRKIKEERRQRAQKKAAEARQDVAQQEKKKEGADMEAARKRRALQLAEAERDRAERDCQAQAKRLSDLLDDFENAQGKRKDLDEHERPILEQEVKLVEERIALEEKEAKHHDDLRGFEENHYSLSATRRPSSPPRGRSHSRSPPGTPRGRRVDGSPITETDIRANRGSPGIGRSYSREFGHDVHSQATPLSPPTQGAFRTPSSIPPRKYDLPSAMPAQSQGSMYARSISSGYQQERQAENRSPARSGSAGGGYGHPAYGDPLAGSPYRQPPPGVYGGSPAMVGPSAAEILAAQQMSRAGYEHPLLAASRVGAPPMDVIPPPTTATSARQASIDREYERLASLSRAAKGETSPRVYY